MATLEDLIRQKQELEKEIEEVTRRERINAINTWTGRGRKPIWLQQAELEGKSLEDFRITSPVAMEEDEEARLEELTRPDNVKA